MSEINLYPKINKALYRVVHAFLSVLIRVFIATVRVKGIENVPKQGGMLLATNHLSAMDIPILFITIPRYLYVYAADKYEKHWWGAIMRVAGAIFIDRENIDRAALKAGQAVLDDGHLLTLAIEGTRSKDGQLQAGKSGVAYLATRSNVPVITVSLSGTESMLSNIKRLKRSKIGVHFSEAITFPEGRARSEQLDAYTDQIMLELARNLPEEYRGVYADRPELRRN